jgi:hypothetical protein
MKLKLQVKGIKAKSQIIKKSVKNDNFEEMSRFLSPLPEDLPLLKTHYPGEWFQRIDKQSVVQRWKDDAGNEQHNFMFYPSTSMIEELNQMEIDWRVRDNYFLLLWKRLQKFGIARYKDIPSNVTAYDFEKYLNKEKPIVKFNLKIKNECKTHCTRLKLKVKK